MSIFRILSQFKQFVQNEEGRELINLLQLYIDIDLYFTISVDRQDLKDQSATSIYEMFFDQASRRYSKDPQERGIFQDVDVKVQVPDKTYLNFDVNFLNMLFS